MPEKFRGGEPLVVQLVPRHKQLVYSGVGQEVVRKYNEMFGGTAVEIPAQALSEGQPVRYSSTLGISGLNEAALPLGARCAFPEEIERLLVHRKLPEAGSVYYDTATVLDFSGNNHDLALDFYRRLPENIRRQIESNRDILPALLVNLGLQKSEVGQYGVAPTYAEGRSQFRPAGILNGPDGNFDPKDPGLTAIGIPLALNPDGTRSLYTTSQSKHEIDNLGLSGFCLVTLRRLGLKAGVDPLAGSTLGGRDLLVQLND
jgi:hypothetical protein